MARTPKRLYGPAQLGNATATRYTVPALTKTVIRKVHVANPTGGAVTVTFGIGADAAGTRIADAYSIAAGTYATWWGPWTLDAAEVFPAHASAASSLVMVVDGDEITLG
jgi:hypothetical protein